MKPVLFASVMTCLVACGSPSRTGVSSTPASESTPAPSAAVTESTAGEDSRLIQVAVAETAASPGPTAFEGPECDQARQPAADALRASRSNPTTVGDLRPETFLCVESHDFDGDGTGDFHVVTNENAGEYFLFVRRSAPVYVGRIVSDRIHPYSCSRTDSGGYCRIYTAQEMHHGETRTLEYTFDGSVYEEGAHSYTDPEPL